MEKIKLFYRNLLYLITIGFEIVCNFLSVFERDAIIVVYFKMSGENSGSRLLVEVCVLDLIVNVIHFAVRHAPGRSTARDVPEK